MLVGDLGEQLLQVGLLGGLFVVERREDRLQMVLFAAGRDRRADHVVERNHPDRVLLPQQEVRQRRGDLAGVLVLGELSRTEQHRLGQVHQQRRAKVCFLLVLLDVVAVGLGPDLPVDAADVVTGRVFAVLSELNRLTEVRAAVQAG